MWFELCVWVCTYYCRYSVLSMVKSQYIAYQLMVQTCVGVHILLSLQRVIHGQVTVHRIPTHGSNVCGCANYTHTICTTTCCPTMPVITLWLLQPLRRHHTLHLGVVMVTTRTMHAQVRMSPASHIDCLWVHFSISS